MEMKKFFETVRIGAAEMVKDYLPLFFLIGNCIFASVAAMFIVKAVAASYLGIELGKVATLIHAVWFGLIGGILLSAFLSRAKDAIMIAFETGENIYSAWKTAGKVAVNQVSA